MEDRLTMIRQQMELTKESLGKNWQSSKSKSRNRLSRPELQSTHYGAVQEVVHSIGNVFDINRHFRRHPWLFIGGSMAVGYAATQILRSRDSGTTACQPREVRVEFDGDTNRHSEQVRPPRN